MKIYGKQQKNVVFISKKYRLRSSIAENWMSPDAIVNKTMFSDNFRQF